jgi:SAM-dependent methyltransferase
MALYDEDLAHIQDIAFGEHAASSMPAILALLRTARPVPRRVVDVGCGAGLSTEALCREGFEVTAIEPSPWLIERARARAPGAEFVRASIHDLDLPPADAVIALGESLGYHAPDVDADARMAAFLRAVAARLSPGGLLLFDLVVSEGPSLERRGFRSEPGWAMLVETTEDRAARRLTRRIETFRETSPGLYRRAREVHEVRTFGESALLAALDRAGFDARAGRAWGQVELLPRRTAFVASRR